MAHDVFVSYSAKDKSIADTIVAALENNQIRCWYAPRDIKPGEDRGKTVNAAIKKSKIFLIIFSSHANRSQRVLDELNYAITQRAIVLPFRVENLEPDDAMGLHLASRHWLDAYEPSWYNHIKRLIKAVSDDLGTNLDNDQIKLPAGLERIAKLQHLKRLKTFIVLVVGIIVIASGWYGWSLLNKEEGDQAALVQEEATFTIEAAKTQETEATSTATPELTIEPTLPDSSTDLGTPDYETDFSPDQIDLDVWPIGERDANGNVYVDPQGMLIVDNIDALMYAGEKSFVDSIIEVDAKFINLEEVNEYSQIILLCRNAYILGRAGHDGYRAHFISTGEVYIDGRHTGNLTTVASRKIDPFQSDKYYRLRFDCVGTQFRVYVNGMVIASGKDSQFYSGNIGLSSEESTIAFDNFKLWFP